VRVFFLFAITALVAATLGSVVVYQRGAQARLGAPTSSPAQLPRRASRERKRAEDAPAPAAETTLETLDLGDVVEHADDDWVVAGAVRYREESDAWALFVLDGGTQKQLLEVTRKGGVQAAFLDVVTDAPTFGVLYQGLTYRAQPYTLQARGDARVTVQGDVVDRRDGTLHYHRYTGPGGALLVIEEEGSARRAYAGHVVPTSTLAFMSGEFNRAGT
jgi:hypothetical protein